VLAAFLTRLHFGHFSGDTQKGILSSILILNTYAGNLIHHTTFLGTSFCDFSHRNDESDQYGIA